MRAIILLTVVAVAYAGMAHREMQSNRVEGMAYREKATPLDGLLCAICKPIVEECEEVGIEYSDKILAKEIEEQCSTMGFFKQLCIDQMEEVVKLLDQYIKEQYSPEVCCQKAGLC